MATIPEPENPGFPEVYEIALDDDVIGGPDGISNKQAKELVERTAYLRGELKEQIEVEKETRETSINNLQKHLINEIFELREHVEEDVVNKFNKEVFSLRAEIPEYIKDEDKSQARITEGSANAYTLTIPGITELFAGLRLNVIFHAANTSATVNININGLGDRRVYQAEALNPVARQIQTGSQWVIEFTGSAFVMYSSRITTGEANNYTLTLDPPITEYIPGKRYHDIFHVANSSAPVNININGFGDRPVHRSGHTSPVTRQIQTGSHWLLEDNG
ncbi:MAG: hypothetical protein LBU66_03245, partial [Treponema sp.]|nr:hypothetical protein [Treponema sp.]